MTVLRLRFQITDEAKGKFLDACPEFLDGIKELEIVFGSDPEDDWNDLLLVLLWFQRDQYHGVL